MRRHGITLALLLGLAASGPALAQCEGLVLGHQPPVSADQGEDLLLTGMISGADEGEALRLWHRRAGNGDFEMLEAWPRGGLLEALLPGEFVAAPGLEYYFEALVDGQSCVEPEGAPVTELFRVPVAGDVTPGAYGSPPEVRILAPAPGAVLPPGEMVLVASLFDEDGDLDAAGVTLRVNGRDRSGEALIRSEVLTWLPDPETDAGDLRVEIGARDRAGNSARPAELRLSLGGTRSQPRVLPPRGRVLVHSRFTDLEGAGAEARQEPDQTHIGRLDARGKLGFLDYRAKAFLTSDEDDESQARNRYQLRLEAGPLRATLGDANPRFSPLSIWGKRMRGVELQVRGFGNFVQLIRGDILRAVEGAGHDSLGAGEPPESWTVVDEAGTYRRRIQGLRFGYGAGQPTGAALSILKIKDDEGSLLYGLQPKDNVVLGADFKSAILDRRLVFDAAASMSWITEDISGGVLTREEADSVFGITMPFDPEGVEGLLVINASTTPIAQTGMSNLALQGRMRARLGEHRLELRLRRIGSVYESLASTALPSDQQGFRLKDSFSLLRRQLRISGEWERFTDNLSQDKNRTLETSIYSTLVSWSPQDGALTGLSGGLRVYGQDNGGEELLDGIRNRTLVLSLGGGLRLPLGEWGQSLRLSGVLTRRDDEISEAGESRGMNLLAESLTTPPGSAWTLGLLLGRSSNEYPGLENVQGETGADANFTTLQLSLDRDGARLPLRAAWRHVIGDGEMAGARSSRSSLTLNGEYRFSETLKLVGRLGHSRFDDESDEDLDYDELFLGLGFEQRF